MGQTVVEVSFIYLSCSHHPVRKILLYLIIVQRQALIGSAFFHVLYDKDLNDKGIFCLICNICASETDCVEQTRMRTLAL